MKIAQKWDEKRGKGERMGNRVEEVGEGRERMAREYLVKSWSGRK